MSKDKVRVGRAIASFVFAPVGIITYFVKKDEKPKAAKAYLGLAIAGFVLGWGGYALNKYLTKDEKKPK